MDTTPRGRFRPPAIPDRQADAVRRRLRTLREAAGIGQIDLAERAGLSRAAVHQIEAGHSPPALGTLYALAAALGCEAADFLTDSAGKKSRRKSSRAIDTSV